MNGLITTLLQLEIKVHCETLWGQFDKESKINWDNIQLTNSLNVTCKINQWDTITKVIYAAVQKHCWVLVFRDIVDFTGHRINQDIMRKIWKKTAEYRKNILLDISQEANIRAVR